MFSLLFEGQIAPFPAEEALESSVL